MLSADDEQAGTSATLPTASGPGIRARLTPSTNHTSARVYPANRTKTAEWLDKNAVVASSKRLRLPIPGTDQPVHRRVLLECMNGMMDRYL